MFLKSRRSRWRFKYELSNENIHKRLLCARRFLEAGKDLVNLVDVSVREFLELEGTLKRCNGAENANQPLLTRSSAWHIYHA